MKAPRSSCGATSRPIGPRSPPRLRLANAGQPSARQPTRTDNAPFPGDPGRHLLSILDSTEPAVERPCRDVTTGQSPNYSFEGGASTTDGSNIARTPCNNEGDARSSIGGI